MSPNLVNKSMINKRTNNLLEWVIEKIISDF